MPFAIVSGANKLVIVDFSQVTFLALAGIRILVKAAQTISNKGGRLVLYGVPPRRVKFSDKPASMPLLRLLTTKRPRSRSATSNANWAN